jgi:hypothetical protein
VDAKPARRMIADFCQHLGQLRRLLTDPRMQAVLEKAAVAGRRGDPLDTSLIELLRLCEVPYDADDGIPPLAILLWHLDFPYSTTRMRLPIRANGHPNAQVYVCPTDHCDRLWVRAPGKTIPTCWLQNARLRERA